MKSIYTMCKKLTDAGKTQGMQVMLDIYLANDRLTVEEYKELCTKLNPEVTA